MGTQPLRVAVLGTGRIGSMHARLLSRQVDEASLAALYDVVPAVAERVAADLGDVWVAADPGQILDSARVDAVAICSSTDTHVDLITAAAEAGKAIFCEKPISLDLAEVDRALEAVARTGVPFQVGFNRRFDPAHRSVRTAVANGEIGEPHLVRISSRDPAPPPVSYLKGSGGIFLDMTIHDFDMARYVTGREVEQVHAMGAVRVDPEIRDAGDLDTAAVMLRHEDDTITVIDNSRQAVYGYDQRVEVFGSAGMAMSDNPAAHTGTVRTAEGTRAPPLPYFFLERYIPSYVAEWEAFASAVREGRETPVTGEDGRAPLVIGLAAWRSIAEGRSVHVAEIEP